MAKRTVEESSLILVADSIRAKAGKSDKLEFPSGFKSAIDSISKSEIKNQDITIKENGTYTPASGFTGFGSVTVEVESMGNDLPNAEDHSYGSVDDYEYGVSTYGSLSSDAQLSNAGYKFTPTEDFAVYGFRFINGNNGPQSTIFRLYDAETQTVLATITEVPNKSMEWQEFKLPTPINLVAGKTYVVSAYGSFRGYCWVSSGVTFNQKLSNVKQVKETSDICPTSTQNIWFGVDIIIGPLSTGTEITEYKIQTATLTEIADEIRRISGETGTITTAQMLALLKTAEAGGSGGSISV